MKINKLTQFLIALCVLFTLASATVITKIVYTPATPMYVRHKVFTDPTDADAFIADLVKDGYVNIRISASRAGSYGSYQTIFIIAEKY